MPTALADPAQRPRLVEIRDNLIARITEADREGWLGEVEGLQISLAGANQKLNQIEQAINRAGAAANMSNVVAVTVTTRHPSP